MPISEDSSQLRRIHFSDMRAPFIMKNQSVYLLFNLDNHPPAFHVTGHQNYWLNIALLTPNIKYCQILCLLKIFIIFFL